MTNIRELSRPYIEEITQTLLLENQRVKAPKFKLDEYQQKLIDTDSRYIRVIAPAGSGKTQTLIAKAVDELQKDSSAKVLCLTFTNAAVKEFDKRTKKRPQSERKRLKVSTLNSFGWNLLLKSKRHLRLISSTNKGTAFYHIKNVMVKHPKIKRKGKDTYEQILDLIDTTKSLGFDHQAVKKHVKQQYQHVKSLHMLPLLETGLSGIGLDIYDIETTVLEIWIPFWKEVVQKFWDSGVVTIEDQKYWCLNQLSNDEELVARFKKKGFTHIMVDEFQDINLIDLYLIAQLALEAKAGLIIVGDDDQCIYEWRGCTSHIIQNPNHYFKAVIGKDEFYEVELSKNYRCPKNVVVHSSKLISKNERRIPKEMIPVRKEDANIRVIPLPAAYVTLNVVLELVSDIAKKHPKHTVAIIGRKKSQLVPLQVLFTRDAINFSIDSNLDVFDGNAFKTFRGILELHTTYTKKRKPAQVIDDFMLLLNNYLQYKISNQDVVAAIRNFLLDYPLKNLADAVEYFAFYDGPFISKYIMPRNISTDLVALLTEKTVAEVLKKASKIFKGLQKDFLKSKEDIFYTDPPFGYLSDLAVNYDKDMRTFLKDLDNAINYAGQNSEKSKIELMTALRTKGREFDTVIVLDVNEGIWPNPKAVEADRVEEERRLFYVTVTRAKNNLLIFESSRVNGETFRQSPFVRNMKLPKSAWLKHPDTDTISKELLRQLQL
ncbi:MAG: ATP-dependent helicase [Tannerellaceae bacterium]|nr:ATP-dependent helicase [Tannerellaceae bacterium]